MPLEKLAEPNTYMNYSVLNRKYQHTHTQSSKWVKFSNISDANQFSGEFVKTNSSGHSALKNTFTTYDSTLESYPKITSHRVFPSDIILTFIGVDEWCLFEKFPIASGEILSHVDGMSVYKFLYDGAIYCYNIVALKEYLLSMFSRYYTKINDTIIELTYVPGSQQTVWKSIETGLPPTRLDLAYNKPSYNSQLATFWYYLENRGFAASFSCGNKFL